MKEEIIKYKSSLFNQEVTLIVDEELNKLKGTVLFPESLREANKALERSTL